MKVNANTIKKIAKIAKIVSGKADGAAVVSTNGFGWTDGSVFYTHGSMASPRFFHDGFVKTAAAIGEAVTIDGNEISIGTNKTAARSENLIDIPRYDETLMTFGMETGEMNTLMSTLAMFTSNEEVRYYMNGVNILVENGKLFLRATNGHVLIQRQIDVFFEEHGMPGCGVTIPRDAVKALIEMTNVKRAFQTLPVEVRIGRSGNRVAIQFTRGDETLTTPQIDADYVNMQYAIDVAMKNKHMFDMTMTAEAALDVCRKARAALVGTGSLAIVLHPNEGHAEFTAADVTVPMTANVTHGEGCPVDMNYKYLEVAAKTAKALDGSKVKRMVLAVHGDKYGPYVSRLKLDDKTACLIMLMRR